MSNTHYPTASEYLDRDDTPSTWLDVAMAHYDATIVVGRGPAGYINATVTINLETDDGERCITASRRGATAEHAVDRLSMAPNNPDTNPEGQPRMKTIAISILAAITIAVPATATTTGTLESLIVADEISDGYERSAFEHWVDADGNGCDTREDVLLAESLVEPEMRDSCRIEVGQWYSSYDGDTITNPSTMDVDHTVPLAEAWRSGAYDWTDAEREAFANDPDVLHAVSSGVNRQKSDRDPASWLPRTGVCEYVIEWVEIKAQYELTVDPEEYAAIEAVLEDC